MGSELIYYGVDAGNGERFKVQADEIDVMHALVRTQTVRICELEARLAELSWKPITPENLPKVGDEVGASDLESGWQVEAWDGRQLIRSSGPAGTHGYGYTHFRPKNAPQGAPDGK